MTTNKYGFWVVVYRNKNTKEHDLCFTNMMAFEDPGNQYFNSEAEAIRVRDRMQKIFEGRVDYWVKYVPWGEFA